MAIPSVIGALLSNSLVAYGFSRVRWPGRDAVFALVLATLILPGFVTFIPLYIMFHRLDWINTYAPLVIPVFFANPFFIFLLRQFFMGLPVELSDAAQGGWCLRVCHLLADHSASGQAGVGGGGAVSVYRKLE